MDVSVVVPVLDEEESLPHLYDLEILRALQASDGNLRVVCFRRNYGQTAALAAGFDRAQGEIVITIDADLR